MSQISDATTAKRMTSIVSDNMCNHDGFEQFLACFRVARVCQQYSWAFLFLRKYPVDLYVSVMFQFQYLRA